MFKVNNNTCAYHSHDLGGAGGNGKHYIATEMLGVHFKNNTELYNKATKMEIDFQVCLARFVPKLTRSLQLEFGEVMEYINKIFTKKEINPICHVPEHYSDLRRMQVDEDNSIARKLPIPIVQINAEHSVVSILDIVADYLLQHDNLINDVHNYDNIFNRFIWVKIITPKHYK